MTDFLTDADLAEHFGVTPEQVATWRRMYQWPRIKVGRVIRYTPEQFAEIVAMQSGRSTTTPTGTGQTKASASRKRTA